MRLMGIISCKIFEDEIVHLVEQDEEIDEVLIIKNESSEGIVRKLCKAGCSCREIPLENVEDHRRLREAYPASVEGLVLVLNVLEIVGMGKRRTRLKLNVYDAVLRMALCSDGLLLLYGLCGNMLKDLEEDFGHLDCPLLYLRDAEGNIVDDCICATLGGKKAFVDTVKSFRGARTFMLTPMWATSWENMIVANGFARNLEKLEESRTVFRAARYTQVAKIDTGLKYQPDFESKVQEFASYYDFNVMEVEADQALFERCYRELKCTVESAGMNVIHGCTRFA